MVPKLRKIKSTVLLVGLLPLLPMFQCVSGMGTKGDNVSYLLNSFQEGYDRRLRPNYGGMSLLHQPIKPLINFLKQQ